MWKSLISKGKENNELEWEFRIKIDPKSPMDEGEENMISTTAHWREKGRIIISLNP